MNDLQPNEAAELRRLEGVIKGALNAASDQAVKAQVALVAIRDQKLYRKTHPTLAAYAFDRWGISHATLYRWLEKGSDLLALGAGDSDEDKKKPQKAIGAGGTVSPRDKKRDKPKVIDTTGTRLDKRGQGILEPTSQQGEDVDDGAGRDHSGSPADSPGAVATTREVAEVPSESEPDTREQHPDPAQGIKAAGTPEQSEPLALEPAWRAWMAALNAVPAKSHPLAWWQKVGSNRFREMNQAITAKIGELK